MTSGGSAIIAIHALREAGFAIEHAICLVDREEGGAANLAAEGVTLHPLFKRSNFSDRLEPKAAAHVEFF